MTRAPFTGPIRSAEGYEVGEADDITTVIDSSGNITGNLTGDVTGNLTGNVTGNVGSTGSPSTVYGYLSGSFSGNAAIEVSTAASTGLATVSSGYFRLFYSSTGGLILKTSTGVVGTVTVS